MLGMWFQQTEGAKFWMQVLGELKQRGVQDILICCVDGLTGFPEAIEAIFPKTTVQTCIVHLIRRSLRYVPRGEYDQVAKDLKPIYTAIDADIAWEALEAFDEKWGRRFPPIVHAWEHVTPFMAFEPEVRRVIYTTDESVKPAAQFHGLWLCRSPVLVGEVGVCEDVARRQGRRRSLGPDGLVTTCGRARSPPRRTPLTPGSVSALGLVQGVVDPERSAGSGTDACRAACPTEGISVASHWRRPRPVCRAPGPASQRPAGGMRARPARRAPARGDGRL